MQKHFLKMYCLGFFLAIILNLFSTCKKAESPVQPPEEQPVVNETTEMKNLSDSLLIAFNKSDKAKVLNCMSEESKEIYSDLLNNSNVSMVAFGAAMEKRTLVFSSGLYAEYEVVVNGETYTISYANCGDGKWQLVRL